MAFSALARACSKTHNSLWHPLALGLDIVSGIALIYVGTQGWVDYHFTVASKDINYLLAGGIAYTAVSLVAAYYITQKLT